MTSFLLLLVVCSAFRGRKDGYGNLRVKKIPQAVLSRCEWGKGDYSLKGGESAEGAAAQRADGVDRGRRRRPRNRNERQIEGATAANNQVAKYAESQCAEQNGISFFIEVLLFGLKSLEHETSDLGAEHWGSPRGGILITKYGKPVAKLLPVHTDYANLIGSFKSKIRSRKIS